MYNKLLNIYLFVMSFWVRAATMEQLYGFDLILIYL